MQFVDSFHAFGAAMRAGVMGKGTEGRFAGTITDQQLMQSDQAIPGSTVFLYTRAPEP